MNILVNKPQAKIIRFASDMMWVDLADGRQLGVPLAYFPRLLHASPAEREKYTISGGGTNLTKISQWPDSCWELEIKRIINLIQ